MNLVWIAILASAFLLLAAVALFYFLTSSRGKSYVAVAATSAIGATWAGYVSLLSVNWPTAALAWSLRAEPQQVLEAAQPNLITIIGGAPIAALISFLLYRLAKMEIERNRHPLNASAREIEEPGRKVGIFELAGAHARYKLSGKIDKPLGTPGEDPYKLPELPRAVDWSTLAADLLVQFEPNLIRESFKPLKEKRYFTLVASDAFDPTQSSTWVVRAVDDEGFDENEICKELDSDFSTRQFDHSVEFVICARSALRIDRQRRTTSGLLVRVLTSATLIESTLNFTQYAASLIKRFEQRPVPGADYSLSDCFLPPRVRQIVSEDELGARAATAESDLLATLRDWTARPGLDHISIIGEFGQGKSTALLAFCCEWARRWASGDRGHRIPLLVELRGKSPRRQAPDRFLAEWGDRYGLRGEALLSLVQSGRAILIFEGFDEVQDAGLRYDRFEQFKALWAFSYPSSKIIFTGRPNFFLDTNEREKLLRSSPAARDAGLENTHIYALSFLDESGINTILARYSDQTRQEILAACKRDPAFFDIAKRPSMLPVIGNQWDRIKPELTSAGGITSAAIIKHFIDFLYARKEADVDRLGDFQLLHRSVRHYFTQRVAWKMVRDRLRNTIDRDRFVSAIEDAYKSLDAEFRVSADADPDVASSIAKLRERFKDRPPSEAIAAIATDVRSNGLLVPDPAGGRDNLYFPHKQYFEFAVGELVANSFRNQRSPETRKLGPRDFDIIDAVRFEPVCLFFASGLLKPEEFARGPRLSVVARIANDIGGSFATIEALIAVANRRTARDVYRVVLQAPLEYRRINLQGRRGARIAAIAAFLVVNFIGAFSMTATLASVGVGSSSSPFYERIFELAGPSEPRVLTAALILLTLITLFLTVALMRVVRTTAFDSSTAFLVMEIYRLGTVQRVARQFGNKASQAVVVLVARALPVGAVELPEPLIRAASLDLGVEPTLWETRPVIT